MPLSKLVRIELGGLHNLNFANIHFLERINAIALLLDLLADNVELANKVLEGGGGCLVGHDLEHLLADLADLSGLSVASLADLVCSALGESKRENTEKITVGGLDVNVCLDERLPLAHKRAKLIGGQVHAVERGQAVASLHILNLQPELTECLVFILVQIGKRNLDDATTESVAGKLGTSRLVDDSEADIGLGENSGSLDIIPLLLGEGVSDLLLGPLLLTELLIFANRHDETGW